VVVGIGPIAPVRIRYKGAFDFDGLYRVMRAWCDERKYTFFEKRYKEKTKPLGNEIEITWEAERPLNEYVQNRVHVFTHLWDINEVEVIKNGKKRRLTRARMLMDIRGVVELDYKGQWEDSYFKKLWRTFYNYFLMREDIKTVYGDKLWYNVQKLQQRVKQFLDMEAHSDIFDDMW
jgi:hypothetical protein